MALCEHAALQHKGMLRLLGRFVVDALFLIFMGFFIVLTFLAIYTLFLVNMRSPALTTSYGDDISANSKMLCFGQDVSDKGFFSSLSNTPRNVSDTELAAFPFQSYEILRCRALVGLLNTGASVYLVALEEPLDHITAIWAVVDSFSSAHLAQHKVYQTVTKYYLVDRVWSFCAFMAQWYFQCPGYSMLYLFGYGVLIAVSFSIPNLDDRVSKLHQEAESGKGKIDKQVLPPSSGAATGDRRPEAKTEDANNESPKPNVRVKHIIQGLTTKLSDSNPKANASALSDTKASRSTIWYRFFLCVVVSTTPAVSFFTGHWFFMEYFSLKRNGYDDDADRLVFWLLPFFLFLSSLFTKKCVSAILRSGSAFDPDVIMVAICSQGPLFQIMASQASSGGNWQSYRLFLAAMGNCLGCFITLTWNVALLHWSQRAKTKSIKPTPTSSTASDAKTNSSHYTGNSFHPAVVQFAQLRENSSPRNAAGAGTNSKEASWIGSDQHSKANTGHVVPGRTNHQEAGAQLKSNAEENFHEATRRHQSFLYRRDATRYEVWRGSTTLWRSIMISVICGNLCWSGAAIAVSMFKTLYSRKLFLNHVCFTENISYTEAFLDPKSAMIYILGSILVLFGVTGSIILLEFLKLDMLRTWAIRRKRFIRIIFLMVFLNGALFAKTLLIESLQLPTC